MRFWTYALLALCTPLLAACGSSDDGALDVAIIGSGEELFASGIKLSPGAQLLRDATESGLVALDADGAVVPALAERWIIMDDGRTFIFRLREGTWPDGEEMTANSVRRALLRQIGALRGTSLGLDLAPIEDVRAMAARVIEIQLSTPVPDMLLLFAQPELALSSGDGGTGPMVLEPEREGEGAQLQMKPPAERGLPEMEDWADYTRAISVRGTPVREAIAGFEDGHFDVILGGNLGGWPLVNVGPLSRGTVRIDPAIGLFGLQVLREDGILADAETREALSMAIDRTELLAAFNVSGWLPTSRMVAPGLAGDEGFVTERWEELSLDERRVEAVKRIAARARTQNSGESGPDEERTAFATLRVVIGNEPGHAALLKALDRQLSLVGVRLERADNRRGADLALVDRTARYADPRWFLNQFNCTLKRGLCSPEADELVKLAQSEPDMRLRATLLSEAETTLADANIYFPLGAPLRWSLVRSSVVNYSANSWAFHPLPELATIPR